MVYCVISFNKSYCIWFFQNYIPLLFVKYIVFKIPKKRKQISIETQISAYFTQLNNEPSWHRSPGKYIMSLRDSFLRSLSTPATQGLPFPPVRRVQSPLYSAELYHITPFLSHNLFRAHLHACKSGVLSLGELVGTPWSDSSHPWTLDTLLPWKSHQGCQLIHSLGNSTFISVD